MREALAAVGQALSHHERLPMPFELGRTLLVKGMIERRARLRVAARDSFGQALAIFEHLGAPLWADKARRELSKMAMSGPLKGKHSGLSRCVILSRCVTGGGRGCAHAGIGGIQGFPVRASRMAVMMSARCLRAVSR